MTSVTPATAAGPSTGSSAVPPARPSGDGPLPEQASIGELLAAASADLSGLVRDEVELAKAEFSQTAATAGKGAGMMGVAAFLAVVAFILLSIAAAYGLVAAGLDPWLAFLIVAVVYILVATVLVFVGRNALRKVKPPERAIRQGKAIPQALKPGAPA